MNSANLCKAKVEIYKFKDRETDYGVYADNLTYVYTTRADVRYESQQRQIDGGEVFFPITARFIVRSYVPVEDNSVIKYEGRYWRVISALPDKYYNNIVITADLINE